VRKLLLLLIFLAPQIAAQQITITATVKDTNSTPYVNGTGNVILTPSNVNWTINGQTVNQTNVPFSMNSFGYFSVSIYSTAAFDQQSSNPKWQFNICSPQYANPGTKFCFSMTPTAYTTSQDISSSAQTQAAILPPYGFNSAYSGLFAGNNTWNGTNTFNSTVTMNGTLAGSISGSPTFTGSPDLITPTISQINGAAALGTSCTGTAPAIVDVSGEWCVNGNTVFGQLNGAAIVGPTSGGPWKYPCTEAGVAQAISDAINLANGVTQSLVDARACTTLSLGTPLSIGSSATSAGTAGLTFLAPYGTWTATSYTAGGCVVKQYGDTEIVGMAFQNPWKISAGSGNTIGSVYCTDTSGYYKMSNVQIADPNGISTNGAFTVTAGADGSRWDNILVAAYGNLGANIGGSAMCCSAGFYNLVSSGDWVSGSIPLQINGSTIGINFTNASIDNPGAGQPNIKITGPHSVVTFTGTLYIQGSTTDTTTPFIQITDTGNGSAVSFQTIQSQPQATGSTAYPILNDGTGLLTVMNLERGGNSSGNNGINESGFGYTVNTNSLNFLTNYSNQGSSILLANTLLFSTTAPGIGAGFNTGTLTRYNGTADLVITVGTGTATSTGTISLPTAPHGWNCHLDNQSRADVIQQTANTATSSTLTNYGTTFAATNFTNSDVLVGWCSAN
jgi:hypothetical protein